VCNWKGFQTPCPSPSNIDPFKHGSEVYRQLVATAQISFRQVGTVRYHRCLDTSQKSKSERRRRNSSFCFIRHPDQKHVHCYTAHQLITSCNGWEPLDMGVAVGFRNYLESEHLFLQFCIWGLISTAAFNPSASCHSSAER